MRAPAFWQRRSIITELLVPLSALYFLAICTKKLFARAPKKVSVPVVCVGNITAGGSGKTPACIAIAQHYAKAGTRVAFLSRGYGGSIKKTTKVDPTTHTAKQVGDEPLLLAAVADTYIGANRYNSALAAIADGAQLLIMDDGLQHTSVAQDARLLVVDGPTGFGNKLLLPAGPLRDKLSTVDNVDMLLIIGDDAHDVAEHFAGVPVFNAQFAPKKTAKPKGTYLPFAGIGRPEKFFGTLEKAGYEFEAAVRLPDHHRYKDKDMAYLRELSTTHNATLITTEKDAVKLPAEFRKQVQVFGVELTFKQPAGFFKAIAKATS